MIILKKKIELRGKINGRPELYSYVRSCEIIFSLELMSELPEMNKKVGDTIVVHYSSSYITYVRENDVIEFFGEIRTKYMKNREIIVSYIEAHQLFNETLQFSLDF